jgi:hypothetical protein
MQKNDRGLYPDVTDEEDVAVHKQLLESFQYSQVEITKQYQVMLHEKDREIQVFVPSMPLFCIVGLGLEEKEKGEILVFCT